MERDKLGRFVKKFLNSGTINYNDGSVIEINGIKFKIKDGANLAYNNRNNNYYSDNNSANNFRFNNQTINDWLKNDGRSYLEIDSSLYTPLYDRPIEINGYKYLFPQEALLEYDKNEKYFEEEGKKYLIPEFLKDQSRRNIRRYNRQSLNNPSNIESDEENPAGVNEIYGNRPVRDFIGSALSKPIDKEKLANFLELSKYGIAASINKKMAERSLEAEKPFLQDVSESHRSIYGDYRAQILGEQSAALLRNMASKPLTSDGALLQQMMMDAQIKGQEFINQGNAQDEALIKQTREVAWQQEKENLQQRQAVAMQNKQAMLMSEKNKAQIENTRDSAMQSMIIDPLLSSREQRLRNEAVEQQTNQDYYYEKMLPREVLNTIKLEDPKQNALRLLWINLGYEGVLEAIAAETYTQNDFDLLSRLINDEILKRQMDYKGVSLNTPPSDPFARWRGGDYSKLKTGGTIYKAKLVKRTRDNDRAAKSIESSKKIAARFLEKALDSLYTYKEVELIAKPKKKRKYLSGGGIPFVGATPVFATSERGATQLKKKEESEDEGLSTKDIIELIMQAQILPSDSDAILAELRNFTVSSYNDPFGLSTSSDITSRYMSIINKIKKALSNREWYDKTFDKLSKDGILNEYAITSKGKLIGMNQEGDFQFFDPTVMTRSEFESTGYLLLTNNNLLDIRAKYPMAAFNHNMILEAANGIGMTLITDYISKVILNLGSEKTQSQVFGDSSKEVLAGLRLLLSAAQEAGQDLSISQMYEANMMNENLVNQAQSAIIYLWDSLPSNMKSLILAKTESYDGALNFITSLVNSKLSSTRKLEFSPKATSKKGSSSSEKDNSELESSLPLNVLKNIGGIDTYLDIDKGNGIHMSIRGTQFNQIKTPSGEPISDTSLSTMLQNSGLQSIVKDMRSIQFGDQKISPEALSFITYTNTGLTRANLPIKSDGSVNLDLLELYENAERDIELSGDKSLENVKAIYEQYGITSLLNNDGTYNQSKFAPFMITEGYTTDALSGIKTSDFVKEYQGNSDAAVALMQKCLSVGSGKNIINPNIDEFSWYNPADWFGWTDTIFKGVIYIPITNNVNAAVYGANQNIDYDEALIQEEKYLNFEKMSDLRSTSSDLLNI